MTDFSAIADKRSQITDEVRSLVLVCVFFFTSSVKALSVDNEKASYIHTSNQDCIPSARRHNVVQITMITAKKIHPKS